MHLFYDFTPEIALDYEPSELASLPFPNPSFVMMVYQTEQTMLGVLSQVNFAKSIYVDDDHGLLLPIAGYLKAENALPLD
jgi:hypothetical protein